MKKNKSAEAASENLGYLITFVGLLSVLVSLFIGNILMANRVLRNFGLGFVAENASLLLWLGLGMAVVGILVVVTSNVDIEE